jgi:transcriptional regulator of acetoin/glycerol metabolism
LANNAAPHHADRVLSVLREAETSAATPSGIADSWRRCLLNHHLDPERSEPPTVLSGMELRHVRDYAGRLLRAADPELERLYGLVQGLGYSVLLADRSGAIIARRVRQGDDDGCRNWRLWTGALWSEDIEGTNGVGTCLAEQRPVTIHRDQHFRRRHTQLTCTVAPVFNAMGELAGALDVSSFRPDPTGRVLPMVMASVRDAARRIEQSCFHAFFARHLIMALPESTDSYSAPLLAVDSDQRIVGATHAARVALHLDDTRLAGSLVLGDLLATAPASVSNSFAEAERAVVVGALAQSQGNVKAAAACLGISRATLHRKILSMRLQRQHRATPL